jgi:hypothetical protein
MIADLFFQRVTHSVGFANRCGGKTLCMAILDLCEQVLKTGVETIHFGAIQAQADAGYQYFRQFILSSPVFQDLIDGESLMSETRFKNGNRIKIAPLTLKQASSPHVPIVAIDELDKVERWNDFQQALSIPVSRNGVKASVRITSTRDIPHGPMNRHLEEAEQKQYTIYEWSAWDVLQPCPEDRDCSFCPAASFCEADLECGVFGRARGLAPGGWMNIQDFINAARDLDEEKFRTQWFNQMPGSDLLIYGHSWDDGRNLVDPHDIPADANRYRTFDFGQRNPTVCLWAYDDGEHLVFYDEFEVENLPGAYLADNINRIEQGRSWHHASANHAVPAKIARSYGDPSGTAYIADLRAEDISVQKADNNLMGGISTVRAGLESGRIRFMKGRCPVTVKQMKKYQWQTSSDGKPMPEAPLKVDDHLPDAVRYLVQSLKTRSGKITGMQIRM